VLFIAPALAFDEASTTLLNSRGFIQRRAGGWGSSMIDIEPSPEIIRASFSSKWRNPLNSAIRAGVEVRVRKDPEAFEWMLERHVANMSQERIRGPAPRFVRAMVAASPESFWVLQAFLGDEPISALMGTCLGAHAENFLGWTNDTGRRVGAHNLLIWHAILEMKAAGSRVLDLGASRRTIVTAPTSVACEVGSTGCVANGSHSEAVPRVGMTRRSRSGHRAGRRRLLTLDLTQ
jgi:hypothetical protein